MRLSIIAAILLSGCAPRIITANSAGGIVNMTVSINGQRKAMEHANAECAKVGRVALSKGVNMLQNTLRYECVAP